MTVTCQGLGASIWYPCKDHQSDEPNQGAVLNINADTVAANIGAALGAEKLLLCTGAAGIFEQLDDPSTLVSYTDLSGLKRLEAGGSFADGMMPKAIGKSFPVRTR